MGRAEGYRLKLEEALAKGLPPFGPLAVAVSAGVNLQVAASAALDERLGDCATT